MNRVWIFFGGVICVLIVSSATFSWWLYRFQSSEVVMRTTYMDGRVEVRGGRVPWRRPDFTAIGTAEKPIISRTKEGAEFRVKKIEFWFRERGAREKLSATFEQLERNLIPVH